MRGAILVSIVELEGLFSEYIPKRWEKMTPAEAGQNPVKRILYYSILRCNTAVRKNGLLPFNYCFGYALGMSFKDTKGCREMLWLKDLDEILETGKTKHGCTLH